MTTIILILMVLFLMSIQPIMMVFSLIFITFLYSLWIYSVMGSFWFSYALIMVMLSGVLVVFTYMVSLIPNESFEIYNLVFIFVFMFLFLIEMSIYYGKDLDLISLNLLNSYLGIFSLFLIVFLLSLMLMVVWLSCENKGSLRIS